MVRSIDDDSPGLLDRITRGHWVGRAREIAEANALWQHVAQGEGQVLLIRGEPGIGKTRFVRELTSVMDLAGARVLIGSCYAEGSVPYAPLRQMVSDMVERTPQAVMDIPDEILRGLLPILPSLSSYFDDKSPNFNSNPRTERQRVFEGFASFCSALSSHRPLLLFIDDVHWADKDTLFLLRELARRIRRWSVLIIMTYREADLEPTSPLKEILVDLNRERLSLQLSLERLSYFETCDLLTKIFDEEITRDIQEGIFRQTEGNPFFIEEVCKTLIEARQLSFEDGHWHYPTVAEISIPQTVQQALQARLQKLPAAAQEVLRMAAILGRDFDSETLKHACDLDEETLINALESALNAGLITEAQTVQTMSPRFSFVHVLIPTAWLESVISIRRQRLHLRAARAIEEIRPDHFELLAYHYHEAGDMERARQFYIRAGNRAQKTAPGEAARFFQAALDLWSDGDHLGRAEILARLGYCLWISDDIENSLKCYQTAYALFNDLGNLTKSGEMQRMIGRLYWLRAEHALALQHYHLALDIQGQGSETLELARAIDSVSQMHMLAHDNDQAIVWGERALNMANILGAEDVIASAMNNIGSSYAQRGDFEKGISILQDSLQLAIAEDLSQEACRAYFNLGVMYQRQCRYRNAKDMMEKLYTYAVKDYSKTYLNLALVRLMWVNWDTGAWKVALNYRPQMVEASDVVCATWGKRLTGMIDLDLGMVNEAIHELEESLPSAIRAHEYQTTVPHWGQLARAYAALGQVDKMMDAINWILQFITSTGYQSIESIMPLLIACQLAAVGTSSKVFATAHACLAQLEQHAQQFHTEEADAALAEAQGVLRLREGHPLEAAENFRQAALSWEIIERRYDQARSLGHYGHALAAQGDRSGAKSAYHQALGIIYSLANQLNSDHRTVFLDSPMVVDFRQAEEALSPISLPKPSESDASPLTKREVEVLKLVAEGLTNAQIAEQLVLSPLTVNAHLRSIFNKLNVTTRTAAAHQGLELGLV